MVPGPVSTSEPGDTCLTEAVAWTAGVGTPVVGRERELEAIEAFLGREDAVAGGQGAGRQGAAGLLLVGAPGIGKSALCEAARSAAVSRHYQVLSAIPSDAEAAFSFAGLSDLLAGIGSEVLSGLPAPQRRALAVALRRADHGPEPPEPFAAAAAFLHILRLIAAEKRVLVAIDDLPWLDASSASAVIYAARRLKVERVRFVLARRAGPTTDLERALGTNLAQIDLAGLSLGAIRVLLSERLPVVLTRAEIRRVYEASQGNPLLALELGRLAPAARLTGPVAVGSEPPLPEAVEDIFSPRVRVLEERVRRAMLAVALCGVVDRRQLSQVVDPLAVEDACSAGLVVVEGSRLRAAHPLLAAAVRQSASAAERRLMHLRLAEAVYDPVVRAKHLALGSVAPDAEVAATVADAMGVSLLRSDLKQAEELAALAFQLTPSGTPEWDERLLELAARRLAVGERQLAEDLIRGHLEELPPGRPRARAHLYLGLATGSAIDELRELDLAMAEGGADREVRATVLVRRSIILAANRVESIEEAEACAYQALRESRAAGHEAMEREALPVLMWARAMRGERVDVDALPGTVSRIDDPTVDESAGGTWAAREDIAGPASAQAAFRGRLHEARASLGEAYREAEENGELWACIGISLKQCEVELRAGDVNAARAILPELREWSSMEGMSFIVARLDAVAAAVAGDPLAAKSAAGVLAADSPIAQQWDYLEVARALGIVALFSGDAGEAVSRFAGVRDRTTAAGVEDPGAFPVAADLIEALVQSGDLAGARDVAERLATVSQEQQHPWGIATSQRGNALVLLVESGFDDLVAGELAGAAATYGDLGCSFDRARTLLCLGALQRGAKRRAEARSTLGSAADAFEVLGCSGWAVKAREELAKVSGRKPGGGLLTPSERQVADLAAAGYSNKEIAARLYVTVYTVETHLRHVYAKLGVSSRSQLASRLTTST